mmetsp:Transcript_100777/g.324994  ORF Transcript_100777/g.324994 Transcript_100777/m.324994 type:complete len:255 (+) Transcript_100777:866-1630(+)
MWRRAVLDTLLLAVIGGPGQLSRLAHEHPGLRSARADAPRGVGALDRRTALRDQAEHAAWQGVLHRPRHGVDIFIRWRGRDGCPSTSWLRLRHRLPRGRAHGLGLGFRCCLAVASIHLRHLARRGDDLEMPRQGQRGETTSRARVCSDCALCLADGSGCLAERTDGCREHLGLGVQLGGLAAVRILHPLDLLRCRIDTTQHRTQHIDAGVLDLPAADGGAGPWVPWFEGADGLPLPACGRCLRGGAHAPAGCRR